MATRSALLSKVGDLTETSGSKITIVGCGAVGMAIAVTCLAQDVTTEISLIDIAEDRLNGEQLDLQHGSVYMNNATISASKDYAISAGSRICIVAVGVRQTEEESSFNLIERSVALFKDIIPRLAEESPNAIIIVVSNPVDILTYVAWKLSNFPKNRVFGSGTNIDSARYRYYISQRLNIGPSAVDGWVIGEHGDASIPMWSSVNIAGVRLSEINDKIGTPQDAEKWYEVHKDVVDCASTITRLKGYSNWGCAFCIAPVCKAILSNSGILFPLSTCVNGEHGIDRDIFLSLPCSVGADGITHVVKQILTDEEKTKFTNSAVVIGSAIDKLVLTEEKPDQ